MPGAVCKKAQAQDGGRGRGHSKGPQLQGPFIPSLKGALGCLADMQMGTHFPSPPPTSGFRKTDLGGAVFGQGGPQDPHGPSVPNGKTGTHRGAQPAWPLLQTTVSVWLSW